MHKHISIFNIIKIHKDTGKCPHLLVQVTVNSTNKGALADGKKGPTKNAMFLDHNLLADV